MDEGAALQAYTQILLDGLVVFGASDRIQRLQHHKAREQMAGLHGALLI
jgi:hypothetical protein